MVHWTKSGGQVIWTAYAASYTALHDVRPDLQPRGRAEFENLIGDNGSRGFWLPPVSNLCLMKANDTRGLWVSPIATALSAAYL